MFTKSRPSSPLAVCFVLASLGLCWFSGAVRAEQSLSETLETLRAAGKYDQALAYLRTAADDPETPAEFKEILDFEIGVTLLEASRDERDIDGRIRRLDQAKESLDKFIMAHATHSRKPAAESKLANLLIERARITIAQCQRGDLSDDDKTTALIEAREMLDDAKGVFVGSRDDLKEKLARITNLDFENPAHRKLIEIRDQYRADYLQARLLIPAIAEEKADTYPVDSDERTALLRSAAEQYEEFYRDFRTRVAGLFARVYQARCNAKLKQFDEALKILHDVFEQPDVPAFRVLKQKTATVAVDCWLDPSQKQYSAAIATIGGLLKDVNSFEATQPDWLYLRLALAKAYFGEAEELKLKTDPAPEIRDKIADFRDRAKKEATIVAEANSEHRSAAKDLLLELNGMKVPAEQPSPPWTFDEARAEGKRFVEQMQVGQKALPDLELRWMKETDAKRKAAAKATLDRFHRTVAASRDSAKQFFQLAIELANEETPIEEMNVVRYFLCYVHYDSGEFKAAADIGESLAKDSPKSSIAMQSAKIALASRLQLFNHARAGVGGPDDDPASALTRVREIARLITQQWPDSPNAAEAAKVLETLDKAGGGN